MRRSDGTVRMPRKPAPKMRPDVNETAYRVMLEATGQVPKTDPAKPRKPERPPAKPKGARKASKRR